MVKRSFKFCETCSFDVEPILDNISITEACERLDIATMLARAQQGILDLDDFHAPMAGDIPSSEVSEASIGQLLGVGSSIADSPFGMQREDAVQEAARLRGIAENYRVDPPADQPADKPADKPADQPSA